MLSCFGSNVKRAPMQLRAPYLQKSEDYFPHPIAPLRVMLNLAGNVTILLERMRKMFIKTPPA